MQPSPGPPLRVLVVDDCPEARVPLRLLLRLRGCDVAEAGDGPEALRQVESFGPDAVLLDLGLPGLSGFEVAGRLRQERPGLCLVAVTGRGGPGDAYAALEAGFDHYLLKPCDPGQIDSLLWPRPAGRPEG